MCSNKSLKTSHPTKLCLFNRVATLFNEHCCVRRTILEDLLIYSFVPIPAISICDRTPNNITAELQNANLFRLRNNQ
jgi:hypothetical protein